MIEQTNDVTQVDVGVGDLKEKYVSQVYDNGEACDITGQLRQTEVGVPQHHCTFVLPAVQEVDLLSSEAFQKTSCYYAGSIRV